MTEPARKKLTITKVAVQTAKPVTPRRFVLGMDATHLDAGGVATALRALADSLEAPARQAAAAVALRDRLAAKDPSLATVTRLEPQQVEGAYPILVGGSKVGEASFVVIEPRRQVALPPRSLSRYVDPWDTAEETVLDDEEEEEDEDIEDEEEEEKGPRDLYDEDEAVEFYYHDQWHPGLVIDRASLFTYIIETKHGQRLEVNIHCLRAAE